MLNPRPLFPILGQRATGLARLAAEATHADDGHLIEFRAIAARSILNKSVSKRMRSLDYSINPYRGCEFGCKYCFARYTHEFLQPEPIHTPPRGTLNIPQQSWALAFEREIYLKENAAWLLEQELKKIDPKDEIVIGTATDPYQPIERRVGITRSLLEVFAKQRGLRLGIITKSNLITRDIDLLQQIAEHNRLVLHITITTTDAALARKLEPRAPRPDLRFAAVKKLREAGLTTGVLCSPLLPGINDGLRSLEAVSSRAAAAGASFLGAHPLFLEVVFASYLAELRSRALPTTCTEYAAPLRHEGLRRQQPTATAWRASCASSAASTNSASVRAKRCSTAMSTPPQTRRESRPHRRAPRWVCRRCSSRLPSVSAHARCRSPSPRGVAQPQAHGGNASTRRA
jgi:DNA repair photolyase